MDLAGAGSGGGALATHFLSHFVRRKSEMVEWDVDN
jgi:hypothetical protein